MTRLTCWCGHHSTTREEARRHHQTHTRTPLDVLKETQ